MLTSLDINRVDHAMPAIRAGLSRRAVRRLKLIGFEALVLTVLLGLAVAFRIAGTGAIG